MLQTLRSRAQEESGFTLIELLVVILIIGILAAIALPSFLGQRAKSQDSSAKSDVRNAVSQMESCFTDNETYVGCSSGNAATVVTADANGYAVRAESKSGNTFTITRTSSGTYTRACDTSAGKTGAGCNGTSW